MSVEAFFSDEPVSKEDIKFYNECKSYYELTQEPLVSVSNEIFHEEKTLTSVTLKIAVDQNLTELNLNELLHKLPEKLALKREDLQLLKIQKNPLLFEFDIPLKPKQSDHKLKLKIMYDKLISEDVLKEFGEMNIFFLLLGSRSEDFQEKQKYRKEITINTQSNRIYSKGHVFWTGPLNDGKDRGGNPYYCPIGWKRYSLYVTADFDEKFKGWSVCYHGTKFKHGLSILLSGLMPANDTAHGSGIYTSPSIIYTAHTRYAEAFRIPETSSFEYFKPGQFVQFVLECRAHPKNIKIKRETLDMKESPIDPNISNDVIEWVIDNQGKELVDFNDPNGSIVCTGLMIRRTDNHPALLTESGWWFKSGLCDKPGWSSFFKNLEPYKKQREKGVVCNIISG